MEIERYRRIDEIFQAALDLAEGEQAAYLDHACECDADLRREVEALLRCDKGDKSFIESPAFELAPELMAGAHSTSLMCREGATVRYVQSQRMEHVDVVSRPTPTASSPFLWLVLLAGVIGLACFLYTGWLAYRWSGDLSKKTDCGFTLGITEQYVTEVDPEGAAADKLQIGDRLLTVDGDTRENGIGPREYLRLREPGSSYTIGVRRAGVEKQFELIIPRANRTTKAIRHLRYSFILYTLGLAYFALAMLIGILKPQDKTARLAFWAFWALAIWFLSFSAGSFSAAPRGVQGYPLVLMKLCFATPVPETLLFHFLYRFPPTVPKARFWSLVGWALTALSTCYVLLRYHYYLDTTMQPNGIEEWLDFLPHLIARFTRLAPDRLWSPMYAIVYAPVYAVMVRNYCLIKAPDQRRRIKWLFYGSSAGLLPISPYLFTLVVFISPSAGPYRIWALAAALILPVSWGYAILKHKVLDINVVIRRGAQYLLAKNALSLFLALPLIGLGIGILEKPDRSLKEMLFTQPLYLLLVAAAAAGLKCRRQLRTWIDRRFFREAYNQEQLLLRLIEEVKETSSMPELFRLVSQQLEAALHPGRVYIFYREADKRDLTLGHSSDGTSPLPTIPRDARLLRALEGHPRAQEYPSPQLDQLPASERAWLDQLKIALLVPMSGTDGGIVGLLFLGEKRSEQHYTATDRRLLEAIARQVAVVYENVRLREHLESEARVRHEVLAHLEEQRINLLKECPACGACYDSAVQACAQDGSDLTLTLPVERTIDGKYRLERLLGKGGMGAVYQGTDLRLGRQVAVKIISGGLFGDQPALRRFEREARASAMLNHPHIVAVYDYGLTGAGGAYLVMEQIVGVTLRDELTRTGCLLPGTAAEWFDQLLAAVSAAHTVGIIHRDLKPENVLLAAVESGPSQVKIVDFGLAKLRHLDPSALSSLTMPGMVMGTLNYMSPEQLAGEEVDERGDIFSLGVMAVEAVTGIRPFNGKTCPELLTAIVQRGYHLPGTGREALHLDGVLQKCLAKDRGQRFSTVSELRQELIPAVRECPPFVRSLRAELPLRSLTNLSI